MNDAVNVHTGSASAELTNSRALSAIALVDRISSTEAAPERGGDGGGADPFLKGSKELHQLRHS